MRAQARSVIALIVIALIILWPRFGHFLEHPNGFLFASQGDGLKNYFVFGYYLKWDKGLHFSGLNYPYGDHLLFTDSHPIMAWLLNLVDDHVFSIADHSVALINLAMIGGILLGAVVIFFILRHYSLPPWYAGVMALGITFLSPQIDRIHGHLSLSYVFAIPLFWLLLVKAESKQEGWRWFMALFIYMLFIGGIHVYYLGIMSVFLLAYALIKLLFRNEALKNFVLENGLLLLCTIVPILLFQLFSVLTDPFADRPQSPYGFYAYFATPGSVFLPHFSSLTYFIQQLFEPKITWEGRSFIGTVPLIFLLVLVAALTFRKSRTLLREGLTPFRLYLLAGVLVLLYAMCIPFRFNLQFLTDWIPQLKQFRALGRFAWMFYYVIGVAAAYYLYQLQGWISSHFSKHLGNVILALGIGIWAVDAGAFYLAHTRDIEQVNWAFENTSSEYLKKLEQVGVTPTDFQAIMVLPIVSIRTDKVAFDRYYGPYQMGMRSAWHTGLPIIQASTSRPSFSQSFSNIQLVGHPMMTKTRMADMDQRPLLLITRKDGSHTLAERRLVDQSEVLWEDGEMQFGRLPVAAFRPELPNVEFEDEPQEVVGSTQLFYTDSVSILYDGFETSDSKIAFRGKGAGTSPTSVDVFKSALDELDGHEASFWVYIDPDYSGMPVVFYHYGAQGGTQERQQIDINRIPDIADGWVRVAIDMSASKWHRIELVGHDITFDELLIKPKNVFVKTLYADGQCALNNYPVMGCP
ncbi:MAG: hypothetical protein HKN87_06220 [Saprospiraceae bacterium]|nr:hypothetical protein [Saprospiraceae bacterium]